MSTLTWTPPEARETPITITVTGARGLTDTYTTAILPAGNPSVVTVAIEQATIEGGDVLGTDVTAAATIVDAGFPEVTSGDITLGWRANGVAVAAGYECEEADEIIATASWALPDQVGSADSPAKIVASWTPRLWGLGDPREEANEVGANLQTGGTAVSATLSNLSSPDAYFPGPRRIASTGANWNTLAIPVGAIADGEKVEISAIWRRGTSGAAMRFLFRDTGLNLATSFDRASGGTVTYTAQQQLGTWDAAPVFEQITGSDGETYDRVTATFTANQTFSDAEIRLGPNSGTSGQYLDAYRIGATRGQAAPANTVLPSISALGLSLTGAAGTWTGVPVPAFAYQWRRDGVDIPGATGTTYDASGEADETEIVLRVTATNNQGSASADSAAFTVGAVAGTVTDVFWEEDTPSVASVNKAQIAGPRRVVVDVADGVMTHPNTGLNGTTVAGGSRSLNGWSSVAWDAGWVATSSVGAKTYTVTRDGHYAVPDAYAYGQMTNRRRWLLQLSQDMAAGETVTIHPSGRADLALTLVYSAATKGFAVATPHHGFASDSPDKRAMVGGWCGAEIPGLSTATRWGLWDVNAGAFVSGWGFADTADLVQERTAAQATTSLNGAENVTSGHLTLWADFSAFTTPGRYRVCVEGYGASYPFDIADEAPAALFRHVARGVRYTAHGDVYRNDMAPDALHYPNPGLQNVAKRATGRTAASWSPDGVGDQGKIWENNNSSNTTYVYTTAFNGRSIAREPDAVLNAIVPDAITEGFRDAADYDIRPQHMLDFALWLMLSMSAPTARAVDMGFGERTSGNGRPYEKTIMGGAISGSVALSDLDHLALHGVDGFTRLQVLASAGSWSAGAGKFPASLGNWSGSVRGGFEFGAYVTWNTNFATWQTNPFDDAAQQYRLNFLRPDPWASYAYAGAAAVASLRFRQLGDATMEAVYAARAKAAYDWAAAHEGATPSWLTPIQVNTSSFKTNWDPAWRSNNNFRHAKALACVGMWSITAPGATRDGYHAAWKSVSGWNTINYTAPIHAAALYLLTAEESSIGVTGHVSADLTSLRTVATGNVTTAGTKIASAAESLYGVPVGWGYGGFSFGNQISTPSASKYYLFAPFVMRGSLTAGQQETLRTAIERETNFIAGRCPSGRTFVTSLGHDFRRSIMLADWGQPRTFAPPGLLGFSLLGNGIAPGGSQTGYRTNGTTTAASMPYAFREVVGDHHSSTAGEFNLMNTLSPSLLATGMAAEFAG